MSTTVLLHTIVLLVFFSFSATILWALLTQEPIELETIYLHRKFCYICLIIVIIKFMVPVKLKPYKEYLTRLWLYNLFYCLSHLRAVVDTSAVWW